MNLPNDTFCVLPWISLEATPTGTVRPCCLADEELRDDAGQKFDLASADFDAIRNSADLRGLREQFLAGQRPQTCRKCWAEERGGRTSKRQHTLNRLRHVLAAEDLAAWNTDARPLMFLDLKLGNICNLKCRICGSWSSSQFAAEEVAWAPREQQKQTYAYQMLRAGAWPRENNQFWSQIDQHLADIRYIEFTGGEPFLIQQHFDMLAGMVDRGIADQVEIHYNTNGTVFPAAAEHIWRHFKTVEIALSIDDVGARFEYQRSNAVWTEVCANLDRFRDLKQIHPNIQLQICCTVNVFNVLYLDQVAEWIGHRAESFDFVYWNVMHDAWYFGIACLPDAVKQHITDHLSTSDRVPAQYRGEFERILAFMNTGAATDGAMTRMKIADLDRKRGQDLRDVAPELAALLNYVKT